MPDEMSSPKTAGSEDFLRERAISDAGSELIDSDPESDSDDSYVSPTLFFKAGGSHYSLIEVYNWAGREKIGREAPSL